MLSAALMTLSLFPSGFSIALPFEQQFCRVSLSPSVGRVVHDCRTRKVFKANSILEKQRLPNGEDVGVFVMCIVASQRRCDTVKKSRERILICTIKRVCHRSSEFLLATLLCLLYYPCRIQMSYRAKERPFESGGTIVN